MAGTYNELTYAEAQSGERRADVRPRSAGNPGFRKIAAVAALIAALTVPTTTAMARPGHPGTVESLRQRVEKLRQERSDLQQRVDSMSSAWWRLDLAIVFLRDNIGIDLPQAVLDAREQSWQEAHAALPRL
jgi:hypothetical protein